MFGSKNRLSQSLSLRVLEITLPQPDDTEKQEHRDPLADIKRSEQLFASLLSIGKPFVFELVVKNIGAEIHFYLVVPEDKQSFATGQVLGLFPEAEVTEAHEYSIFSPGSVVAGGELHTKQLPVLPIRSYEDAQVDTFALILSSFAKLEESGEGAALQLIVSQQNASFAKSVRSMLERVRKGESISALMDTSVLTELGKFFKSAPEAKKEGEPYQPPIVDEAAVSALDKKIAKPLLSVEARIVVSASSKERAEHMVNDITASFGQFSGPMRSDLILRPERNQKKLAYRYVFREMHGGAMPLNTEELASIFHLPTESTATPRIARHSQKAVDTPITLSREGVVVGESSFRGERKQVMLADDDRRRHVYMVGQTGTGKSTLIKSMIIQDIIAGKGVCLIDPNGDLVEDVLGLVPLSRIDDVIVFDPSKMGRPLGLNMLEFDPSHPEQKTFIVNEMQSIFNRLFAQETMGPMFEQYMRNALLLLLEDAANEPATLIEVPRVFTDGLWRNRKLDRIKNQLVVDFWRKEAERAGGEGSLANMTPYITSKFGGFISNDFLRPIIGQTTSAFDFRKIMDEGKILLVKLPKGKIGEINAHLLGMIITGRLLMAALGRDDMQQDARRDFYLYIDEFQNFTTDSIATILSEARKYRLNLTIAHQYLGQLTDNIRDAVFGNAGTLITFRVGANDAGQLESQVAPNFHSSDLISLENLHAVIRPLVNGQPTRAFNMHLVLPDRGSPEVAEKLAELSALTYGATLAEVENGIAQRLR